MSDRFLDHAVITQVRFARYANNRIAEGQKFIAQADKEIRPIILGIEYPARVAPITDALETVLARSHAQIVGFMQETADEVALLAVETELALLENAKFERPSRVDILSRIREQPFQGATFKEWINEYTRSDRTRIIRQVRDDLVWRKPAQTILKGAIGTKTQHMKEGVREVARRGFATLTRTIISHASSQAREQVWITNKKLVKKVIWVSVLDGKTSDTCRHLDGTLYAVGVGPRPPAHLNCRSTVIPLLHGQAIPGKYTWITWLEKQPESIQKEALGATRYKLWKQGGVKPEKFADADGEQHTLVELRKLMPAAFKRIE